MTILTTPSRLMKKPFLEADTVNLENGEDQKVVFVERGLAPGSRSTGALLCMSVVALLVASAGFLCGLELYQNYMRTDMMHRYKGFCSIPVDLRDDDTSMVDPQYRVMPLRWSSSPDVQVFSTAEEDTSDDFVKHIREQLDIGDMVEKISVISPGGRQTSFIHDFSTNISGIVDSDRCFVMELDTHLVMPPSAFVMTIEGNGDFDVSRVREAMRALLPPLADIMSLSPHLAVTCNNKPTYRLQKESITIRKRRALRSVQPDKYTHFSGHHVQQIEIDNLAELRAYEEKKD